MIPANFALKKQFANRRRIVVGSLLMICLASTSCSKSDSLVTVKGSVVVKGEAAKGALVLFHPKGKPNGVTASGVVGDDGKYTLASGLDKGVAVGSYIVTVIWPDPSKKPKEGQIMMNNVDVDIPDLFKGRYANRDQSTLKADIDAKTTEVPAFELQLP